MAIICQLDEWLEYNSTAILDCFLFWFWKLQRFPKKWIQIIIYQLIWTKKATMFILEIALNSDPKWNQEKVQDYCWVVLKSTHQVDRYFEFSSKPKNNVPTTFHQLFNLWIYKTCCLWMETDWIFFSYLILVYNLSCISAWMNFRTRYISLKVYF